MIYKYERDSYMFNGLFYVYIHIYDSFSLTAFFSIFIILKLLLGNLIIYLYIYIVVNDNV